ncbi:MAG: NHL repeat-containing protein [Alphaproteobacteria bacterium]
MILGAEMADLPAPVTPSRTSLFGPRGGCLVSPDGPLWVADTGHHRLLGWRRRPDHDQAPADWVIGQKDFASEGRNGKRATPDAASVNVPTGITRYGRGLAVADAWNHRVLIWNELPEDSRVPADLGLGQPDCRSVLANRGRLDAGPGTLNWCYGVHADGERLYVADTGNRRVLIWDRPPVEQGQPADAVLGQEDMTCRDENAGRGPDAATMRWPHQIAVIDGRLAVTDAGNNRIMVWNTPRPESGQPADLILGQAAPDQVEHNRGRYLPDAASLNMPYGLAAAGSRFTKGSRLIVADTANSRLLGYDDLSADAVATRLAGQPDFASKGDNRWRNATRDSLCWPYAVSICERTVVIADSGNNRVLLWDLAS